jgi:predicted ester cyclase
LGGTCQGLHGVLAEAPEPHDVQTEAEHRDAVFEGRHATLLSWVENRVAHDRHTMAGGGGLHLLISVADDKGDMAVFEETIASDFVNHTPQQGQSADRDSVAYFFNEMLRPAFPDLKVTIHDQVAERDEVVTRKSYSATHLGVFLGVAPTGRLVEFSVIDILKLRNGQYVEHWACADMLGLLGQLTS